MGKALAYLGLGILCLFLLTLVVAMVWLLVTAVVTEPMSGLIIIGVLGLFALMLWTAAYFMDA